MHNLENLLQKWPSDIVSRSEIPTFTGGAVASGTIANADCQGKGPKGRFCIGKRVCYPAASVVEWLKGRAKPVAMKRGE